MILNFVGIVVDSKNSDLESHQHADKLGEVYLGWVKWGVLRKVKTV